MTTFHEKVPLAYKLEGLFSMHEQQCPLKPTHKVFKLLISHVQKPLEKPLSQMLMFGGPHTQQATVKREDQRLVYKQP